MGVRTFVDFYAALKEGKGGVEFVRPGGVRVLGARPDGSFPVHLFFRGLNAVQFADLEKSLNTTVPSVFADFLSHSDGASLFRGGLRLFGHPVYRDVAQQPISLTYGNVIERPRGIPRDHFVIGTQATSESSYVYIYVRPDGGVGTTPREVFADIQMDKEFYEALLELGTLAWVEA